MTKNRYRVLGLRTVLLGLTAAIVAVITVAAGISTIAASGTVNAKRKLPIYGVNTDEKVIALTFDCAWENSDTDRLMDILSRSGVKATFFATGDFCKRYPEDIKRIFNEGHDIQNHSYAHPHVENIAAEKLIADTNKCDSIIEDLTGVRPTLYRAPYGEYSDGMLTVFEAQLGHKVIQWDCERHDIKVKPLLM